MTPIDLKDCTLFLIDGTGANFIAIRIGEGNFSYTGKRNIEQRKARGQLDKVREGEEDVTSITFQFVWDLMISSDDEPPTMEEVLYGEAGWTSASADTNAPFSVHLQIVRSLTCRQPNGTNYTDGETYNFPEFYQEELSHSLKDSTVDCKGFSNRVRPTITRDLT